MICRATVIALREVYSQAKDKMRLLVVRIFVTCMSTCHSQQLTKNHLTTIASEATVLHRTNNWFRRTVELKRINRFSSMYFLHTNDRAATVLQLRPNVCLEVVR